MRKDKVTILLFLLVLVPCRNATGIRVDLNEKDVEDALRIGSKQGFNVTKYLEQRYRLREENVFEENGMIRTKWSKLTMLSGLLAIKSRRPTSQEKERILKSTYLQIDIYTFGNTIDFADAYKIQLIQNGKIIKPEKISASHAAYQPEKKIVTAGFPKYRATVRSFFLYDKISPDEKSEIILIKNKKKVVFEINYADYK